MHICTSSYQVQDLLYIHHGYNWEGTLAYCDGVVLEIYLDHKFQQPQESLNCESLAYKVVTKPTLALWPSGLGNDFVCKRSAVQTLLW